MVHEISLSRALPSSYPVVMAEFRAAFKKVFQLGYSSWTPKCHIVYDHYEVREDRFICYWLLVTTFKLSLNQEYFEWTGRSLRWADTSGVEAVHSRLRYQQLSNNTRITNPAKFGTPIHKVKLKKSLVYFAGKNLGRVGDSEDSSEDSEDEDPRDQHQAGDVQEVPGEVSATGGDQVAVPGEDGADANRGEDGFDLGEVEAGPEEAADAEEGIHSPDAGPEEAAGAEEGIQEVGAGHLEPAGAGLQGDGQLVSGTDEGEDCRNIVTPKTTRKRKFKSKLEYMEENVMLKKQLEEKDNIIAELRKQLRKK